MGVCGGVVDRVEPSCCVCRGITDCVELSSCVCIMVSCVLFSGVSVISLLRLSLGGQVCVVIYVI